MIYSLINSPKVKIHKAAFHVFLIISYLTAFSGCMTTYHYSESPETINTKSSDEITKIELKNGTVIDCKDKVITYETGDDSVKYIVVKSLAEGKNSKVYNSEKRISEKDILKINLEHSKINVQKTVLLGLAVVIAVGLVVIIISASTSKGSLNLGEF